MAVILSRRDFGMLLAVIGVGVGRARAADPEQASAPVKALDAALIEAMKAGRDKPFRDRYATLAPAIESAFDLPSILQVSVGPRWASLPPAMQAQLLHVFRRFTIASYVANFDNYEGERFEILPETRSLGADEVVETRMIAGNGKAVRVDYVMHEEGGDWKATDVLLDGSISRVAVQRSDFRSLLGQGGAADLIASLQRKVADLSGGALDS
jgi:phospholipid transport system substrate-binding protein